MKKWIIVLVLFVFQMSCYASYVDKQLKGVKKNVKYNTVQDHKKNYEKGSQYVYKPLQNIKDPKLITTVDYTPVDKKAYELKLQKDEEIYKNKILPALSTKTQTVNVEPNYIDFYNLYRVAERLIRANNLEYVNWRIAVRKTRDFNAGSTMVNYIVINTGLYDSLYTNEDAMAFVLAHEMSHLILGHQKQEDELLTRFEQAYRIDMMFNPTYKTYSQAYMGEQALIAGLARRIREMEYLADTEALILLTRAGYDPNKALEALNFINAFGGLETYWSDHPIAPKRIANYKEHMPLSYPDWVEEGKSNIYNSSVLDCKKSSDHVSFVINKSNDLKKLYEVEDVVSRLTRIAYMNYLNGNYANAVKYFEKLSDADKTNYVPYVYIALSNEALYNRLKQDKYMQKAKKAIEKAVELHPNDAVVLDIARDITNSAKL